MSPILKTRKSWNKLKISNFPGTVTELKLQSKGLPWNLETQVNIEITAKVHLPGEKAARAITWQEHLNGNFDKPTDAEYRLEWQWIAPGGLGRPSDFLGFSLQGPQILTGKRSPHSSGKGSRKVTILKYTQSILHTKGLLSSKKDFTSALPHQGQKSICTQNRELDRQERKLGSYCNTCRR